MNKRSLLIVIATLLLCFQALAQSAFPKFVPEEEMMDDLLAMMARFSTYLVNDFQPCSKTNSMGETCGCFRGECTMQKNEEGVRTNADLSMICAFLVKYAQPRNLTLPEGVTYEILARYARKSLVFAYSTHKANRLMECVGGGYWGSVSLSDNVWESSLWAMSVAFSAWMQWDKLSEKQQGYIYALLKAECNYELERRVPTKYVGDTRAEENGWEVDVLAATLGLFPNDKLAPKWFERMRMFAINCYSHRLDAFNNSIIDPDFNNSTISKLYLGPNLYDDYTVQNHNFFHSSYQNVVIQELGEAALALHLFQQTSQPKRLWHSNALMHNNQQVMDSVLNWLALVDGELAMPNGNDWSLFLYDQITSYSTLATMLRDPNALLLENLAYQQIKARQLTTPDGAWLLRPDIYARRMGVQAHRVMMTYLMHLAFSTRNLKPTKWEDFRRQHSAAKIFPYQFIVRNNTASRFTCFSWSEGLNSYTGYFAPNSIKAANIVVPFRANNTGNLLGWYETKRWRSNAKDVYRSKPTLFGDGYWLNGILWQNDGVLRRHFSLCSTPHNALIYLDWVEALESCDITQSKCGMLAISNDEMTSLQRTFAFDDGHSGIARLTADGTQMVEMQSAWVNIDEQIGVVTSEGRSMAFGDRENNNSILTSKLYPRWLSEPRHFKYKTVVDSQYVVYYSLVSSIETQRRARQVRSLLPHLPKGWNGVIVPDDECAYLFVSNFCGDSTAIQLSDLEWNGWAPILTEQCEVVGFKTRCNLNVEPKQSYSQAVTVGIRQRKKRRQAPTLNETLPPVNISVKQLSPTKIEVQSERTVVVEACFDMSRQKKVQRRKVKANVPIIFSDPKRAKRSNN